MIEIERQICEAPDICVIVQYSTHEQRAHIARFERESGEVIAYPGQDEFRRIVDEFFEEIKGAIADCIEQAEKAPKE